MIPRDQVGGVAVDAEEVRRVSDALNLAVREVGQTRPGESLTLAERIDAFNHLGRVVALVDRMTEPAHLGEITEKDL